MTQKLNLFLLRLEFSNMCYLVVLITESCEILMQHKCVLRCSIPSEFIYHVLPSLWQICIFTVGLIVPSRSSYKNLMCFLLCDLVKFMSSTRLRLACMVLKGSCKQDKWAQLIDLVVKFSLPGPRLRCLQLQWKCLVSNRATPCCHQWLACDYHLPAPETEWWQCSLIPCQHSWL